MNGNWELTHVLGVVTPSSRQGTVWLELASGRHLPLMTLISQPEKPSLGTRRGQRQLRAISGGNERPFPMHRVAGRSVGERRVFAHLYLVKAQAVLGGHQALERVQI